MTPAVDPQRLDELVALSLELGDPARDLAILAEGNTSARIDDESFWVKASGTSLARAEHPDDYVAVRIAPLLDTLKSGEELGEPEVRRRPREAAVDGTLRGRRRSRRSCTPPAWTSAAPRSSPTRIRPR